MHWVSHVTGLDNPSGYWYLFWSGIGGFAILTITNMWVHLRRHNCHEHRCWRLGRYVELGTPYVKCRRHHPTVV